MVAGRDGNGAGRDGAGQSRAGPWCVESMVS